MIFHVDQRAFVQNSNQFQPHIPPGAVVTTVGMVLQMVFKNSSLNLKAEQLGAQIIEWRAFSEFL